MNYGKEFKKFATKHHGVNSMYYDKIVGSMTPYIIEERQLNISQLDVFSRLMMDRIIFMGTGVDDHMANIIQAQLLFLELARPMQNLWKLNLSQLLRPAIWLIYPSTKLF